MRFWIQFKHKFMQGARNSWFDAGYEQLSKWLRRSCRSPFKLKIITPIVELMLRFRRDLMISTSGHRSGLCTEIIHWDGLVGWLLQHLHKASVHTRKTRKAAWWPIWCFFFFFESIIYLHLHSFTPPFAHTISISLRGCIVLHKHFHEICYLGGPGSAGSMNTQEQSAKVGKIWVKALDESPFRLRPAFHCFRLHVQINCPLLGTGFQGLTKPRDLWHSECKSWVMRWIESQ